VRVAALPVVFWLSIGKVQLVKFPDAGVPRIGVTNVGLVANTNAPEPVSSLIKVLSCAEVVDANCDKEFAVVA
jgi:hypothetical protein